MLKNLLLSPSFYVCLFYHIMWSLRSADFFNYFSSCVTHTARDSALHITEMLLKIIELK